MKTFFIDITSNRDGKHCFENLINFFCDKLLKLINYRTFYELIKSFTKILRIKYLLIKT